MFFYKPCTNQYLISTLSIPHVCLERISVFVSILNADLGMKKLLRCLQILWERKVTGSYKIIIVFSDHFGSLVTSLSPLSGLLIPLIMAYAELGLTTHDVLFPKYKFKQY